MTLSKYERETIIIYNQAEPNAMVYTHDPKLIAKLRRCIVQPPQLKHSLSLFGGGGFCVNLFKALQQRT